MPVSPALKGFIDTIKDEDKSNRDISSRLRKIIDDYCQSGKFDKYCDDHPYLLEKYIRKPHGERLGLFRASSAGKCIQEQCFNIVWNTNGLDRSGNADVPPPSINGELLFKIPVARPARQYRAMHNGTFAHVRWHVLFEALHDEGLIRTVFAEELRYYESLSLSGTPDRVVEIPFKGKDVRCIIDFKTIKQEYFDKLVGAQDDHKMQQHAYDLFDFDAQRWIMLYEGKNTQDLKIYDYIYDVDILQQLHKQYRAAQIWIKEVAARQLPTVVLDLETTWCNRCEWNKVCKIINPQREDLQRAM